MKYFQFTELLDKRNKIKEICPTVKTVAEIYGEDGCQINIVCRELNCSENELLLTPEEYQTLNSYEYR